MARTKRESEKRSRKLVGAAETSKELAEWRRLQQNTVSAEKERVASVPLREQLVNTPEPPLPKGKRTKPSVQISRSRGARESR